MANSNESNVTQSSFYIAVTFKQPVALLSSCNTHLHAPTHLLGMAVAFTRQSPSYLGSRLGRPGFYLYMAVTGISIWGHLHLRTLLAAVLVWQSSSYGSHSHGSHLHKAVIFIYSGRLRIAVVFI